ncbi:MAG: glycoside hydrolase family 25 protein [Sediminibacterium sp.]|nr:glycoside hydrolase family 25 protein [Sediminibacterium sp.]
MGRRHSLKSIWKAVLFAMSGILIAYLFYHEWQALQERRSAALHYSAFGIQMPVGWPIHGIDVSIHQGWVSWPSVKHMNVEGIQMGFAYLKATEGLEDTDKRFHHNWKKARKAGLVCGAYHYFLATKSGKEQASHFIKQVKLEAGDLPPVIDIESLYGVSPELMRVRVKEWLAVVEAHYGVRPLVYTYADFYEKNLGKEFDQYPLWVAHYLEPGAPRVSRPWTLWQHSELGRVNGIRTTVDCNVFNGDSLAWRNFLIR